LALGKPTDTTPRNGQSAFGPVCQIVTSLSSILRRAGSNLAENCRWGEAVDRMRKTIFEVAVAVAAAVIVLMVAAVNGSLHGLLRWLLVIAVALVACVVAWLAARRVSGTRTSGVEIANRLQSKGNVDVQDISIESTGHDVSVANDIRSKRAILISKIRVGKARGCSK
jgi:hypothetical protein